MIERDVIVSTRYGQMPSFAACPDGSGPFPAVLLLMDAPAIREELRHMARRIARQGYFCLLPDLYYRLGTIRFDVPRRSDAMSGVIRAALESLNNDLVMDDVAGMLAFIDGQDRAKAGPVGCVGHCMSGAFAVCAAARYSHRIAAAASLYGTRLVTDKPDSPNLQIKNVKGELYFAFAEHDPQTPPDLVAQVRKDLADAAIKNRIDVFAGTQHGYCFPERAVYAPAAAEETWTQLFALWARTLK
jgi:carboxymethylenebutenolidase